MAIDINKDNLEKEILKAQGVFLRIGRCPNECFRRIRRNF